MLTASDRRIVAALRFGLVSGICLLVLIIGLLLARAPASAQSQGQNVRLFAADPTTGTWTALQSGSAGGLSTGGYTPSNITTNATTVLKTGKGQLHCLTVNSVGTTSTATIYDNTAASGTKIGTATTVLAGQTNCYDIVFSTGLTVVTAGAAAADLTVGWR